MINTTVVNVRYAIVNHPKMWSDFKVYPNGIVEEWKVSDDNVDGWWSYYDEYEHYYNEIKQAGLKALEEDNEKHDN